MAEQVGWRGLVERVRQEAPYWGTLLPQLPRLVHQVLARQAHLAANREMEELLREQRRQNRLLAIIAALLAVVAGALIFLQR
jgi:ubiquinone biosynthesis protein